MKKTCLSILSLLIFNLSIIMQPGIALAGSKWDGQYNASFDFVMSSSSVCPKSLPIEIEIIVTNGKAKGYIFNNGGGNTNKFCKLYHNGNISGVVKDNGDVKFKVKQKDNHARKYSSNKIIGSIKKNELSLVSKIGQLEDSRKYYQPQYSFEFYKIVSSYVNIEEEKRLAKEKLANEKQLAKEKLAKEKQLAKEKLAKEKQLVKEKLANEKQLAKEKKLENKIKVISTSIKSIEKDIDSIKSVGEAQTYIDNTQATINMYLSISEVLQDAKNNKNNKIIQKKIAELRSQKDVVQASLTKRFSTPIKPNNANLSITAFRSAEIFPKIPFYMPGTNEIGEMLVIPRVTDDGYLVYQLDFLDPTSVYDQVRDRINIFHEDIDKTIMGLGKINIWTEVAQKQKINKRVSKTSVCIPSDVCESKKEGVTSTEVIFQVYEDGSTSGRIQRNKGLFSTGYNLSVESTVLLSSYLIYMKEIGAREFRTGSMSETEIEDLFQ